MRPGCDQCDRPTWHIETSTLVVGECLTTRIDNTDGIFVVEVRFEGVLFEISSEEERAAKMRRLPYGGAVQDVFTIRASRPPGPTAFAPRTEGASGFVRLLS
jgi:hypothetical protein